MRKTIPTTLLLCFILTGCATQGPTKNVSKSAPPDSKSAPTAPKTPVTSKSAQAPDPHSSDNPLPRYRTPNPVDSHAARTTRTQTPETGTLGKNTSQTASTETYTDIWPRIRKGYRFESHDHPKIDAEIRSFVPHPKYISRVIERARPFMYHIVEELEKRDMPMELALLPIVESGFQPFAYSHGQAAGIWQFIPSTAQGFGLKQNWWYDGRRDILASTSAALDYLQRLHKTFDGDWLLALAAYNAGTGTVSRAIRKNEQQNKATDFWSLRLPKETRNYVPRLLAFSEIFLVPEKYDITLEPIDNSPHFEVVDIGSQIDLSLAAELADMDIETLYRLNPGFNRWATDPDGPHKLLVPINKAEQFRTKLAELDISQRMKWKLHRVRSGETLSAIAMHHNTTVSNLQQVNQIKGHHIRAGAQLLVPLANMDISQYTLSADARKRKLLSAERKGNKIIHTVKSGDTLWDIARQYNVNSRDIARWNDIAMKDTLKPGQQLAIWRRIPAPSAATQKMTAAASGLSTTLPESVIRPVNYRVRNGDSLYSIAKRFNVKINDLLNWNRITGQYLQPGQLLRIFVDITNLSESI